MFERWLLKCVILGTMEILDRMLGFIKKGMEDIRAGGGVPLQKFIVNDSCCWSSSSLPKSSVEKVGNIQKLEMGAIRSIQQY